MGVEAGGLAADAGDGVGGSELGFALAQGGEIAVGVQGAAPLASEKSGVVGGHVNI